MFNLFEFNKSTMIKDDNPIIRKISKKVEFPLSESDKMLVAKMMKYMLDSNNPELAEQKNLEPALGLAAIQVGVPSRIFVMIDVDTGKLIPVLNPKILKKSKQEAFLEDGEGCLSVPKKKDGYVYRSYQIEVEYYNMEGKKISKTYEELQSIVFQHEYDHLDGKIYSDYISEENPFLEKEGAIIL